MVLEFYYDLLSQPCRSVYIFLKAAGIKFEAKPLELTKGDHYKPDFVKKNPFHKVPIIIDDGVMISESAAIMRYCAGKFKVADHWFPQNDLIQNTRLLEYFGYHPTAIRKHGVNIFIDLVMSRIDGFFGPKRPSNEKQLAESKEALSKSIKELADYFLKDKPFIVGKEISVADLLCICELMQLNGVEEAGIYESNPNVKAWVARVKERTKPHFEEAHAKIDEIGDRYSKAK